MSNNKFDIVIVGAGLSGLCLAVELIKRTDKKILILEKEKEKKKDKNWCFWNIPRNDFTGKTDFSWDKIKIKNRNNSIIKSFDGIKYLNISSKSFFDQMLKIISTNRRCKILFNQNISSIKENSKNILISSNNRSYQSNLLFDSRTPRYPCGKLTQNFFGTEVIANKPIFENDIATLMDFQKNNTSIHFFYLLPFSKKKALIETTYLSQKRCSDTQYKSDIKDYLIRNYPKIKFKFGFNESGIIPMFKIQNSSTSKKIIKIGLSNNWSRMSSGYAFQNSFILSKKIVDLIINKKPLILHEKKITTFLDKVFCKYLETFPRNAPDLFFIFFSKLNLKTIVCFLTDTYSKIELIKILISLPKLRLIYSVLLALKND